MMFTVVVHVATVLSTLVVLGGEVWRLLRGTFSRPAGGSGLGYLNAEQRYVLNIVVSMIPIGIVGVFFKDDVEAIFGQGLPVVGCCLLLTALLLAFSYYARPRQREHISLRDAFIIGLGQALAVLPGLSRSGTTIATGLMLGNKKSSMAQFSFLMVIPPILGEALLDVREAFKVGVDVAFNGLSTSVLLVGFVAAFVSGVVACRWMINIVSKGKLILRLVLPRRRRVDNHLEPMNFLAGQILAFDKPLGMTSFGLVAKVRWLLTRRMGGRKIKVGHAGTLDPWRRA